MIGEFFSLMLGQRPVRFDGKSLRCLMSAETTLPVSFVRDLDQHHLARMALDKCYGIAVPQSANHSAFPMASDCTIFNRCRSISEYASGEGRLALREAGAKT